MARTNNAEVQLILPSSIDYTPYIDSASLIVDKLAASPCGSGLTSAELQEIEKYVALHFATVANPKLSLQSEKVEGAQVVAQRGNTASMSGIMGTQWGQSANMLSGGCLEEILKAKPTVSFF